MSATVMWKAVKPGKSIGKSALRDVLERGFGDLPKVFTNAHVEHLGFAARMVSDEEMRGKIEELILAIEQHGEIEVYLEY